MYVCMYVCMNVLCVYVCVYVCICMYVCTTYVRMYLCMYAQTPIIQAISNVTAQDKSCILLALIEPDTRPEKCKCELCAHLGIQVTIICKLHYI